MRVGISNWSRNPRSHELSRRLHCVVATPSMRSVSYSLVAENAVASKKMKVEPRFTLTKAQSIQCLEGLDGAFRRSSATIWGLTESGSPCPASLSVLVMCLHSSLRHVTLRGSRKSLGPC